MGGAWGFLFLPVAALVMCRSVEPSKAPAWHAELLLLARVYSTGQDICASIHRSLILWGLGQFCLRPPFLEYIGITPWVCADPLCELPQPLAGGETDLLQVPVSSSQLPSLPLVLQHLEESGPPLCLTQPVGYPDLPLNTLLVYIFVFVSFWDSGSLGSIGYPQTYGDPPASPPQALGLQVHATNLNFCSVFQCSL